MHYNHQKHIENLEQTYNNILKKQEEQINNLEAKISRVGENNIVIQHVENFISKDK